jgi:hypothetical protein
MAHERVRTLLAALAAALAGGVLASAPPASADQSTVLAGSGYFEIVDLREINGEPFAWRNNGSFNSGPNIYPGPPGSIGLGWIDPARMKFGDIDGDTYDELISVDTDGDVRAFRNVNGTYPGTGVVIGTGWMEPYRTFFADINGDGRDEIIHNRGDGVVLAWRNVNGLSTNAFSSGSQEIGVGWFEPLDIFFADINGDSRDEIISLRPNGEVWAFRNVNGLNPNTYPSGPQIIGVGWDWTNPWRLKFADLNNDQRAEIISVDPNGDVRAFRNVNGLNPNTYPEPAKRIGVGWSEPSRVFFAEVYA